MGKVYFKNTSDWKKISAVLVNRYDQSEERINLIAKNGNYNIEFDNSKYDYLYFECDGQQTGKVYPGSLSIGIEHKRNENLNKNLTYLFSKDRLITGRVENFVLEDAENLNYRADKCKKISVFLPNTYDGVIPHDILYFFDAQNLFGAAGDYTKNGDPYGSWQLDTVLSAADKNIIVVGIDNADEYREKELFMDPASFGSRSEALADENYSEGYLDDLSAFIRNTLHPYIKEKYCVSESNIGIGGSSMGGIASFYCGLHEMGFYKYVLSYSPAFALYEMSAFDTWFKKIDFHNNTLPKVHIYCGEGDPLEKLLLGASKEMKQVMVANGYPDEKIFETFDTEKPHNEESWRLILPQSFTYLLDLK